MLNTSSKRVITLTVVTIVIILCLFLIMNKEKPLPVVQVDANEITFDTPEKLDAAADLIIIASPSKDFMDREHMVTFFDDGTIEDFYTLTEVQVDKVIKTPDNFILPKNNSFSIIEPVGIVERSTGNRKLVTNHYKELKEKSSYIMFLQQNSMGQYGIINNNLGKFNLDNKDPLDIGEKKSSEAKKFKDDVLQKYSID
ncbi:hypothetical protein ACQKMI_05950 [Lysinibacillus sp. NPDC097214]|uniref:hypothetical protein n=1 Tax=Lysinibacillus sp. NPDC097214 TaxID=3390584 RepID=UPI003D010420